LSAVTPLDLLIDLHVRNDRQGPGGDAQTRRALELAGLGPDAGLVVADVGCGTGASSLVLGGALGAHIFGVDAAPAFVEALRARADRAGLGGLVRAEVGRMEALPFGDGELDLLWSEGAIYNIGFDAGVRGWRRFLKPGGVLAVSELSWTTDRRPADVESHWAREYPGIDTTGAKLRVLERAGYAPLGFFFLPRRCWEENYYGPLERGFPAFLGRHAGSPAARSIVGAEEAEIGLFRARGQWYGYGFYIACRLDGG
jgi:SAM-dependent methyltransferase